MKTNFVVLQKTNFLNLLYLDDDDHDDDDDGGDDVVHLSLLCQGMFYGGPSLSSKLSLLITKY